MKKLILDKSTWRCGGNLIIETNRLGEGTTALLNDQGYMCCLGQFSLQIDEKLNKQDLLGVRDPLELETDLEDLTYYDGEIFGNTGLSNKAIDINDDSSTTIEEKIESLKALFLEHGYLIEVI